MAMNSAADYWTTGASIFTNAFGTGPTELRIKGVSWFGLENRKCYIGGATDTPVRDVAEFLTDNGFNAVRVPLAADAVLSEGKAHCVDAGVYYDYNAGGRKRHTHAHAKRPCHATDSPPRHACASVFT